MWKRLDRKISRSRKLPNISDIAFRVWVHTLPHSDTAGRFPADPQIIKSECLTRYEYRLEQVETALQELEREKLIHLYDIGKERYVVFHDHAEWNPPGALAGNKPEFPAPPPSLCPCLMKEKERGPDAALAASIPSRPVSSPSLGEGKEGSGEPSGEPEKEALPEYAMSPAAGLVPLFSFCRVPGANAKAVALEDLLRQGFDAGRITAYATCPDYRSWDFYQIVRAIQGNGKHKKSGLDRFMESQGGKP